VSAADQVLKDERASDRQRRETRAILRRARREGRIAQALYDTRMQSIPRKTTTAELKELTSDLGEPEGLDLRYATLVMCGLLVAVAAWEPFWMSGRLAWLFLALPVTGLALFMWAFREYLI
jgi:Domain of unknown function (DUF1707)